MSPELRELVQACTNADTDKTSDRKKWSEQIKAMLDTKHICRKLHNVDTSKEGKQFSWDVIFKYAIRIFEKDHSALTKSKSSKVGKRTCDPLTLIKMVLKNSSSDGQVRLKPSNVVKLLNNFLTVGEFRDSYAQDLLNSAFKYFLIFKDTWINIDQKLAIELCDHLKGIMTNQPTNSNFDLLSICRFLCISVEHITIFKTGLPESFASQSDSIFRLLKNSMISGSSLELLEHLLRVCNLVMCSWFLDLRNYFCNLGEELFLPLLNVWKKRPSDKLKVQVLMFYRLQILVHHPCGSVSKDGGAFYVKDLEEWKNMLKELFYILINSLNETAVRGRFLSSASDSPEESNQIFIELISELLYCLYNLCGESFMEGEVCCLTWDGTYPPATKRRKVTGSLRTWEWILNTIKSNPSSVSLWSEILVSFISKYPKNVSAEDLISLAKEFGLHLHESKRTNLIENILKCLDTIIICLHEQHNVSLQNLNLIRNLTQTIESLITTRHAIDQSFNLLSNLIRFGLYRPSDDLWMSFQPNLLKPSPSILNFVLTFLATYHVPEVSSGHKNVRLLLLRWLLPELEAHFEGDKSTSCGVLSIENINHLRTSALVLSRICLSKLGLKSLNPSSNINVPRDVFPYQNLYISFKEKSLQSAEKMLLMTSLDNFLLEFSENGVISECDSENSTKTSYLLDISKDVVDILCRDVFYFNSLGSQSEIHQLERHARMCCIGLEFLFVSHKGWACSLNDAKFHQLIDQLKVCFQKLYENMSHYFSQSQLSKADNLINAFLGLLEACNSSGDKNACANLLKNILPSGFPDFLLKFVKKRKSKRNNDFDDENTEGDDNDDMFESVIPMTSVQNFQDFNVNSSQYDSSNSSMPSCCNYPVLAKDEQVQMLIAQWLCRWLNMLPGGSPHILHELVSLVSMASESASFHSLQLMQTIIVELTLGFHVRNKIANEFVESIRSFSEKSSKRDQEITKTMLNLLSVVAPHLEPQGEAYACALNMVTFYWQLMHKDDYYNEETCLSLVKCTLSFIKTERSREVSNFMSSMCESVCKMMKKKKFLYRIMSLYIVPSLFGNGENFETQVYLLSKSKQQQIFKELATTIYESLEDASHPVASFFHCLVVVWKSSLICQKKVFHFILQTMKGVTSISFETINKVLKHLAEVRGSSSQTEFVSEQLSHGIKFWLKAGHSIVDFPYKIMSYEDCTEFFECNRGVVMPELASRTKYHCELSKVTTLLNNELQDLITKIQPEIIIPLLPSLALSESINKECSQLKVKDALLCLEKLPFPKGIKISIQENLIKIIQRMFLLYHELEDSMVIFSEDGDLSEDSNYPEPDFVLYNRSSTVMTLNYLMSLFKVSNFMQLLMMTPDGLQVVSVELTCKFHEETTLSEKLRKILSLEFFVSLLTPHLHLISSSSLPFLIQHLFTFSTNFLHSTMERMSANGFKGRQIIVVDHIVRVFCRMLVSFIKASAKVLPQEVTYFVPLIVSCAVDLSRSHDKWRILGLDILQLLRCESGAEVAEMFSSLDPLPARICRDLGIVDGDKTGTTLREVIETFLACTEAYKKVASVGDVALSRSHGIEALIESLRINWSDLPQVLISIKSEIMELPQHPDFLLFFKLMKTQFEMLLENGVSKSSESLNIAVSLGILGPVTFDHPLEMELPLNGMEESTLLSLSDDISIYCKIITSYLSKYLVDKSTSVIRTSCMVLKRLFQSKKGKIVLNKIDETEGQSRRIRNVMNPFVDGRSNGEIEEISNKSDLKSLILSDTTWHNFKDSCQKFVLSLLSSKEFSSDDFLVCLKPICELKKELCRFLLPCLFHKVLLHPDASRLIDHISSYFDSILLGFIQNKDSNEETVRDIILVVQYLRSKQRTNESTSWDNNFWLRLDFLLLSQAALKMNKFYSALLFAEIHCLQGGDVSSEEVQSVWVEVYDRIEDIDSIYGCSKHISLKSCHRMKMLERNNEWHKSLVLSDILISQDVAAGSDASASGQYGVSLMKALQKLGCHHLLGSTFSKLHEFEMSEDVKEMQYQSAWEMSKWDLNIDEDQNGTTGFHKSVYGSMQALKLQNFDLLEHYVATARANLMKSVVKLNHEGQCMASMTSSLTKLRCLSELEELSKVLRERQELPEEVLKRWHSEEFICDFDDAELILKQRCAVSQLIQVQSTTLSQPSCSSSCGSTQSIGNRMYHDHVKQILLQLTTHALRAKRLEVAEKALMMVKEMSPEEEHFPSIQDWQLEEAKIFWARGELDMAKYLINRLVDKHENSILGAKCLLLFGDILVETQSENPITIMETLYKKAVDMLGEDVMPSETSVDAFYSLASYADAQYKMKMEYMESSAFDDKLELMNQARDEVLKMRECSQTNNRYFKTQDKQLKIDEIETQQLRSDCSQFLFYSLENYLRCLQRSSKHDSCIYRLISLWFNNLDESKVNEVMEAYVSRISSHKFVPLMYQLAARMNLSKDSFQAILTKIVERAAMDHPHHVLPIILSLAHANLDDNLAGRTSRREVSIRCSRNNQSGLPDEERMIATQNLIGQLKKKAPTNIQHLTNHMELLSKAYIELANWNVDKFKGETKPIKFPAGMTLPQMKYHPSVAVLTVHLPISPLGKYDEVVHLIGLESTFALAGGINLPKIITCRCSDGVRRKQLVKGRDDLRQDAVMQQVFNSVNGFLKRDGETRKRNLRLRTYKVVPLSQRSGLLEWCADTKPLGDYLCGTTDGAHQRYRPKDLKPMDCRKQMTAAHGRANDDERLATYLNICTRFKPVFRHFFLENYQEATTWFQRRLAYTRSVATNSIVGYILGLGDRHVQNILVDMKLAELIHIDFGVAFEQGWNLPTPETVPFRLTRDLVDGMGVTGSEGVFRRCCEKTMGVMRTNREVLMTIIEVFLYDPLYDWAMSPIKAYHVQNKRKLDIDATEASESDLFTEKSDNSHLNKVAKRVLLRMNQKLCGFEGSIQLSVEGHVNRLIQQATDPKNLSRLFPGWQPYV